MTEATFIKLSSSATSDVVSSVGGPQTGVDDWIQRLTAKSEPSTVMHAQCGFYASMYTTCILKRTRGQSNLTKSASWGAHSPVRGHARGSKVVPLNSWGRVSY